MTAAPEGGQAFLSQAFPGMILRVPLIGQWSSGARFTLGGDDGWLVEDRPRIDRIHRRATAIFEACFAPNDEGFVVAQYEEPTAMILDDPIPASALKTGGRVPIEGARPVRSGLFAELSELRPYIAAEVLSGARLTTGINLHGTFSERYAPVGVAIDPADVSDDIAFVDAALDVAPQALDYRSLLAATANRETPAEPSVRCQLYFVNTTTALICNIPDDRSLHVIGATSAVLRPLVSGFVDWLDSCYLPTDRP
jgi:hypothetical protein